MPRKLAILKKILLLLTSMIVSAALANPPAPRDESFSARTAFEEERLTFPFIKIVERRLPDGVTEINDIVYARYDERELRLNLFYPQPKSAREKLPAVLLVHGGGWRSGDRANQIPMAQQLAARGYVTAAVEYRLSPEALYPAAVHDLKAAIRWLRVNAEKYSADPQRIAILGCSAGGQLAALTGMSHGIQQLEGHGGNPDVSSAVQAIVNIDGLMDFTSEEARKHEDDPRKNPSAAGAWFGGRYHEKPETWKNASPLYYVNEKTPPVLFLSSSIPRFHVGRDKVIEKLESLGIYHEVHTFADTPHPFWLFHPWFEQATDYVTAFLDKTLKNN